MTNEQREEFKKWTKEQLITQINVLMRENEKLKAKDVHRNVQIEKARALDSEIAESMLINGRCE